MDKDHKHDGTEKEIKLPQGKIRVDMDDDLDLPTASKVIKQEILDEEDLNFVDCGQFLKADITVGEQPLVKEECIEENTSFEIKPNNGGSQEEVGFETNKNLDVPAADVFIKQENTDAEEFDFVDCGQFSKTDIEIEKESLVKEECAEENESTEQILQCEQDFNSLEQCYVEIKQLDSFLVKDHNKPHKCPICGKGFLQKGALPAHIRIHSGEKPFECEICSARFNHTSNLKAHVRAHSGIKEYKCETCDASFNHRSNLNAHIRAHSGIKEYKCEICNKCFIKKSHLNNHIQIHTGIKLFKCKICGKDFSRNTILTRHIQTHSGVKPHECETCGRRFLRKHQLIRHFKVHIKTS